MTRIAIATGNRWPSLTGGLSSGLAATATAGGDESAPIADWEQATSAIAIAIAASAHRIAKLFIVVKLDNKVGANLNMRKVGSSNLDFVKLGTASIEVPQQVREGGCS